MNTTGVLRALAMVMILGQGQARAEDAHENRFGDSVRHMIEQQIFDPKAARNPAVDPPATTDAERAAAALKLYREQAGKPPTAMTREVPIGILAR